MKLGFDMKGLRYVLSQAMVELYDFVVKSGFLFAQLYRNKFSSIDLEAYAVSNNRGATRT
jgi:hypothetical protein